MPEILSTRLDSSRLVLLQFELEREIRRSDELGEKKKKKTKKIRDTLTDRMLIERAQWTSSTRDFAISRVTHIAGRAPIFSGQHLAPVHRAAYGSNEDWPRARRIRTLPDTETPNRVFVFPR